VYLSVGEKRKETKTERREEEGGKDSQAEQIEGGRDDMNGEKHGERRVCSVDRMGWDEDNFSISTILFLILFFFSFRDLLFLCV